MARRTKKPAPSVVVGSRIAVAVNGLKWSGLEIPLDTRGTVYLHPRHDGRFWRCVAWDGFPKLQANGYPYSIGGDQDSTYCPSWARRA